MDNQKNKFPWYAIPCIVIFGIPLLIYGGAWIIAGIAFYGAAALLNKLFDK